MPKINRRPQITEKSESTEKGVTALMRLNWLEAASNNAVGYANKYADEPFKAQATAELRDAHRLMLELLYDPTIRGPQDLGGRYVKARAEQLAKSYEKPVRSHDWTPTNEESEPPF
ncbi:hypothetical protein SEA_NANCIA_34 [Arthrobacter phage Nancia]|uniref:Uncharacterized protein n=5 Tax=Korravirus drrobert TaxID=1982078 RepID=A0A222ZH89_9CAUD|nr:hypothetical protein SEA_LUCY_34 [Arthrobacter phage Lucy]ASR83828.1 hypothetical protein SEA_PITADOG_34 [Arthrobacter phage PitaDog]AZF98290.1 hypothetical protein SEA_BODACIOUS_34 [Arthrobacter phage Bodacious]AZS07017.1 hypothetical protein SEA_CHEWCHEW_34 [Arthrobacter phage ChewChew]AZS09121.1 hypothetical protein SEA_NANCIA_34 [Arthrobacter phage Nancia]